MACPPMGLLRVSLAFARIISEGGRHSSKRRRRGRIAATGKRLTHGGRRGREEDEEGTREKNKQDKMMKEEKKTRANADWICPRARAVELRSPIPVLWTRAVQLVLGTYGGASKESCRLRACGRCSEPY